MRYPFISIPVSLLLLAACAANQPPTPVVTIEPRQNCTDAEQTIADAVSALAPCAAFQPRYQMRSDGPRQSRADAERTHIGTVPIESSSSYDSQVQVASSLLPDYPQSWQRAGITGKVVVEFLVQPDGTVRNPTVLGSPRPELAAIVLHAIMQWKFIPATRNGVAVAARVRQQFDFRVE